MAARHSTEDQSLTRVLLKQTLYALDSMLAGETEIPCQLNAQDYTEAHELIGRLYRVIKNAKLQQTKIGKAKADTTFQHFLNAVREGPLS